MSVVTLSITLRVNGKTHKVNVDPTTPLLWVLRDHLGLTGTKYGCGIAQCGANITTIEGLSENGDHVLQKLWAEMNVPQCGYCQAGMLMAAAAMLKQVKKPTDKDIDVYVSNICRCGTYPRIRAAIHRATGTSST